MTRGTVRRLGAAALVLGCLIVVVGQASAEPAPPTISIGGAGATEGQAAAFTITRDGTDEDLTVPSTVSVATSDGTATAGTDYSTTTDTITFAAGEKNKPFTVPTTEDEFDEDDETFTVTVSVVSNGTPGSTTAQGTITDGDAAPVVSISPGPSVAEGAQAAFNVSISGKSENTVSVNYAGASASATVGADFTVAPPGQLTWNSGDATSRTITVSTMDDALDEDTETYNINLSGYSSIGSSSATGNIVDGDDPPTATIANAPDVTEGGVARFAVTLDRPSGRTVNVTYRTTNGSAQSGSDFQGTPGASIQIAAGSQSGEIAVETIEDAAPEASETFTVGLTANDTIRLGTPNEATAKILDNESPPTLSVVGGQVTEGNAGESSLNFTLKLSAPSAQPIHVTASTASGGTASAGVDFEPKTERFTFTATQVEKVFSVTVNGDSLDELPETVKVVLSDPDPSGAPISSSEALGTIVDDDNNSKLSISDASADEPGTMTFTVTLSPASGRVVTVNWATAAGTATEGVDYTAGSGGVTFAPGEGSKTIDVAIAGDSLDEAHETLTVNLSSPSGVPAANLLDGQGAGTIVDKNAPPSLSISDAIAREGAGATFTVSLAGTTLQEVKVNFSTADGSAKAGSDYAPRSGTLTFAAGEKSKTIAVTVTDDTQSEPVEEFFVQLGDPVSAAITKSRGQGSIEASDRSDTPVTDPTKPPVGKPASVLVPRMILGPRTVSIGANGIARMLVTCQKLSPIGCAGTVELERAVKPLLKLGKKTFTVKKGAKGYASVKLSAKTLKLLRKNGTMRAKVIVLVKTSTKTIKVSPGIITLKATKALLKPKAKSKPKPKPPSTQVVVDP